MRFKTTYWIAGLPVALRYRRVKPRTALDGLRHFYALRYWSEGKYARRVRKRAQSVLLPRLWYDLISYTRLNGRIVRRRYGVSVWTQVVGQVRAYLRHGILPRWYYIFSLFDPRSGPAGLFLNRFETKALLFPFLNEGGRSPLGDKVGFADHCRANDIAHVPVLAVARDGAVELRTDPIPQGNIFIKPIRARGGTGAEAWSLIGTNRYLGPGDVELHLDALLERLRRQSEDTPRLIQPRVVNHPDISDLSNGALTTVRVLSCLDEQGKPEIIGAAFRMAVGENTTVDNFHAGGIAAAVDVESGQLGQASNIGADASFGWTSRHPDTNAVIEGRTLPSWPDVVQLVQHAHLAFKDRTIIGWDVGLLEGGPALVEGNGNPDVDIIQRMLRHGIGGGRFADLLWHHLQKRLKEES